MSSIQAYLLGFLLCYWVDNDVCARKLETLAFGSKMFIHVALDNESLPIDQDLHNSPPFVLHSINFDSMVLGHNWQRPNESLCHCHVTMAGPSTGALAERHRTSHIKTRGSRYGSTKINTSRVVQEIQTYCPGIIHHNAIWEVLSVDQWVDHTNNLIWNQLQRYEDARHVCVIFDVSCDFVEALKDRLIVTNPIRDAMRASTVWDTGGLKWQIVYAGRKVLEFINLVYKLCQREERENGLIKAVS